MMSPLSTLVYSYGEEFYCIYCGCFDFLVLANVEVDFVYLVWV